MGGGGGGLSGGFGRRRRLAPNADINVTSLVDVAFVLLIIFMLTAPLMLGGVEVDLPQASSRPLTPRPGVVISVNRNGRIFVDRTPVSYADFRASFRALVANRGTSNVYFHGDRRAPYGSVVRVFAAMREVGGQNIKVNVVTEEEEIPR